MDLFEEENLTNDQEAQLKEAWEGKTVGELLSGQIWDVLRMLSNLELANGTFVNVFETLSTVEQDKLAALATATPEWGHIWGDKIFNKDFINFDASAAQKFTESDDFLHSDWDNDAEMEAFASSLVSFDKGNSNVQEEIENGTATTSTVVDAEGCSVRYIGEGIVLWNLQVNEFT